MRYRNHGINPCLLLPAEDARQLRHGLITLELYPADAAILTYPLRTAADGDACTPPTPALGTTLDALATTFDLRAFTGYRAFGHALPTIEVFSFAAVREELLTLALSEAGQVDPATETP